MKKIRIIFYLLFPLFSVQAQMSTKQIDSLVIRALKKYDVVGASVGIVKDGKIIHAKGYGFASYNTKQLADEHTSFAIASNSKAFTSAALAILVEQGKLDWKDKVTNYIPKFKMYNPYVTENFLIVDLLTHRSGLGTGAGDLMAFPDGSNFTIEDVVKCFQYLQPKSAFRAQFDYDNLLYWVAGEIIARVSGMSFDDFVETHIFKPLSMTNSFGELGSTTKSNNVAMPHIVDQNNGLRQIEPFKDKINSAAGGLYSSALDMCKWMLLQLNQGSYGNQLENTLFSKSSQREMWRIHTVMDVHKNPHYNNHFMGYGLGWWVSDIAGKLSIMHTGGQPGMLSKTWLIPELNLGVVVLTNTSDSGGALYAAVSKTIMDTYLNLEKVDWIENHYQKLEKRYQMDDDVTQKVWEQVIQNKKSKIDLNNYIGIYEDPWFGKVEVYKANSLIWFKSLRSPKLKGSLYYYKANTFVAKWDDRNLQADAFVTFQMNEEGDAETIKMKGISPIMDFSYDFQDLNLVKISK